MKKFKLLRLKMYDQDVTQEDIAQHIANVLNNTCSISHVSDLFNGRSSWRMDEAYAVLELLKVPHSELHKYFPKDGERSCYVQI
ncbi:helix-turn-helix transcriptional regulator [Christensenella tenuis]|uniref:Helix-turn-helix transcriptional regulator n=1 Tax=Christensenella tenuis TaxID=2763033 RepID=A0ABR7ECP9_9FIRM|nr:helix-turn-helix transcriptional regulator [Christensenella tenuis]MBC5647540.1 helix-turn-helix transcriptional regulator [Christensenella tenuis]